MGQKDTTLAGKMSADIPDWLKRSSAAKKEASPTTPRKSLPPTNEISLDQLEKMRLEDESVLSQLTDRWNLLGIDGALEGVRILLDGSNIGKVEQKTEKGRLVGIARTIYGGRSVTGSTDTGEYQTRSETTLVTKPIFFLLLGISAISVNGFSGYSQYMPKDLGQIKDTEELRSKLDNYLEKLIKTPHSNNQRQSTDASQKNKPRFHEAA